MRVQHLLPLALFAGLAFGAPGGGQTIGSLPLSAPGGVGDKGAEDGSCHEDDDGERAKLDFHGTTLGHHEVTITVGDESGEGIGTPASDDNLRESSEINVGDDWFQVKDGKVQKRTDPEDKDSYEDMDQVKDSECAGEKSLPL